MSFDYVRTIASNHKESFVQIRKIFFLTFLLATQTIHIKASFVGSFQQVAGSPFAAGNSPAWSEFTPLVSGNMFVGVPNYNDASVTMYSLNQTTGFLTQVTGSPFATGNQPAFLRFSPLVSGNVFAGVVNHNDDNVSVYLLNQSTGALAPVTGSPFPTGAGPYGIDFSLASGTLLCAICNAGDSTLVTYTVNQSTGEFFAVDTAATGAGTYLVAFSPVTLANKLFAAVTNEDDNTVSVFEVDQLSGLLTPVTGSPFATGNRPIGIEFTPVVSGNLFAAVTNANDNTVSVYSVDQTTGVFSQVPGSPFPAGSDPNAIAFSPLIQGNLYAAVVNFNVLFSRSGNNGVSVYQVDQLTGAFTPLGDSPFGTGTQPDGIAYSSILPNGKIFAVVANFGSNNTSLFEVLTQASPTCSTIPLFLTING